MSVFDTKCPACGTVLQIQDDWVGAEAMCPSCQKSFIIQKDVPTAAIVATTSKTTKCFSFFYIHIRFFRIFLRFIY